MAFDDEDIINYLKSYDSEGKQHPPITDVLNPYDYNPEYLRRLINFHRDGKAYFYAAYVEEPDINSGSGWMRGGVRRIMDVGETLGFKETFNYIKNGNATYWTMKKYFLHEKGSSLNENVIYVVSG